MLLKATKKLPESIYNFGGRKILLFAIFLVAVGCLSKNKQPPPKKEPIGKTKIILKVKHTQDIPILLKRLEQYSKISHNEVLTSVDSNKLSIEIFDLFRKNIVTKFLQINGDFLMRGRNNSMITQDNFTFSIDSFSPPCPPTLGIKFIFDTVHQKVLENFMRTNINHQTEIFLGKTRIAAPRVTNVIKNGRLTLCLPNQLNGHFVFAAATTKYPHDIDFDVLDYIIFFRDSIVTNDLRQQLKLLKKKFPIQRLKKENKRLLKRIDASKESYKLSVVIAWLYELFRADIIYLLKTKNFKNYSDVKTYLSEMDFYVKSFNDSIISTNDFVNKVYNLHEIYQMKLQ